MLDLQTRSKCNTLVQKLKGGLSKRKGWTDGEVGKTNQEDFPTLFNGPLGGNVFQTLDTN